MFEEKHYNPCYSAEIFILFIVDNTMDSLMRNTISPAIVSNTDPVEAGML